MTLLRRLLALVFPQAALKSKAPEKAPLDGQDVEIAETRLHVPRSVMRAMRSATLPTSMLPEPLLLLFVRFASEQRLDIVVAVAAKLFPDHAYVDGFAGANFDTTWVIDVANDAITTNVGLFLVHAHGGSGSPRFSEVDKKTNRNIMAVLASGVTTAPYGAMVLSENSASAVLARDGGLVEIRVVEVLDAMGKFEMSA